MTDHNDKFDDLADRLVENRSTLEPVDLDRIKLRTLGKGASYSFGRGNVTRKVLAPVLALGLMAGGSMAALSDDGTEAAKNPPATCGYKKDGKPKSCKKPPKCKSNPKPNDPKPPNCTPKTHK